MGKIYVSVKFKNSFFCVSVKFIMAFRLLFPTGQNRFLKSLLAQAKYFLTAISAALGIIEAYRFSALLRKEPSFRFRWHEISFKGKLPFVDC